MPTQTESRTSDNPRAWFVGIVIAYALVAIGYSVFSANTSPHARAGLDFLVLTDSVTGCEYLSKHNAMTPRLGTDGNQICRPVTP